MEKIVITGGLGFVGSHVVDNLLKNKNYQIIIIDNLSSGDKNNVPFSNNLKLYESDIKDSSLEQIFEKEKPDYIIHLAAQTSVDSSIKNASYDASANIISSIHLLDICKEFKIKKLIVASSAAVYGNPKYLPIDENHPTNPMSPYGLSKLTMEKYIQLYDIPYIIFRFSNAYGPRQKSSKESGVIAIFDKAMKENSEINIFGDGEQIRDFIYVEDIAKACTMAIKNDIQNEIINFSTNKGETLNNLFYEMSQLYNYKNGANYLPERTGDIKDSILSNEKFIKLFGNFKFTSLKSGLEKLRKYN